METERHEHEEHQEHQEDPRLDALWSLLPVLLARTGGPIGRADLNLIARAGGGRVQYPTEDTDDSTGQGEADHVLCFLTYMNKWGRGGQGLVEAMKPERKPREGSRQHEWLRRAREDMEWAAERPWTLEEREKLEHAARIVRDVCSRRRRHLT